jgi:hypothetical protein
MAIALLLVPQAARSQPAVQGKWSDPFDTENVMIHASLLPTGKVLFWSRREAGEKINVTVCTPRIWDPKLKTGPGAVLPTDNKPGYNLFCSGHAFLPDGRLFVAGGHAGQDLHGEPHVTIYNPMDNKWTPLGSLPDMTGGGRWYPTAVALSDGGIVVSMGDNDMGKPNHTSEVWKDGSFRPLPDANFGDSMEYPRMHLVSDGRVFMTGPQKLTQFLDTSDRGIWTPLSDRDTRNNKDYAPSVLYTETPDDPGKILYIGGDNFPTNAVEILDLNATPPTWTTTDSMQFNRRQHNATLLPDGTIVVMGGTQGTGAKYVDEQNGFNDLRIGQPIRSAEIYDPKKAAGHHWSKMAKASVDRCYHSIALLLPDATVLSAGGGEYNPPRKDDMENLPTDSHKDAQIFSPPYLFRSDGTPADRPDITSAPDDVGYGDTFDVGTTHPNDIGKVTWIRLSSVTHSFNSNQRINVLKFTADATTLKVTAPGNPKLCPPGHYLLFVLNKDGVPSIAKIIKIHLP